LRSDTIARSNTIAMTSDMIAMSDTEAVAHRGGRGATGWLELEWSCGDRSVDGEASHYQLKPSRAG
jgi:hypothetical protein